MVEWHCAGKPLKTQEINDNQQSAKTKNYKFYWNRARINSPEPSSNPSTEIHSVSKNLLSYLSSRKLLSLAKRDQIFCQKLSSTDQVPIESQSKDFFQKGSYQI